MPPTIRLGQLATDEVLAAQLVVDMDTDVFQYDPPGAPMMRVITKRMGSEPADATTVRWMEDEPIPYWDTLAEALDTVETAIDVTNGAQYAVGNLVKVIETDEVFRVTGFASTNTLNVTRAWAGTASNALTAGFLLNLSTAEMEGDVAPEARVTVKVERTNFTQIVKDTVEITGTLAAVKNYSGPERRYQQRKVGEQHARRWEEIALHGRKKEDTSTGQKPIRSCGGIDETITTNVVAYGGVMTETEFIDAVSDVFRFSVKPGRTRKIALMSTNAINTINGWGLNKLQLDNSASQTYGMDISTYVAGSARLEIIDHPLLEFGYEGAYYIVDPDGMRYRPLRGRGTKLYQDVGEDRVDGSTDLYMTEASFQYALDKVHGKGTGITF